MADLPPDAVQHLWPVLLIIGATVTVLASIVGGLAIGFRWLKDQIKETSAEMLAPVVARVALVEKTADAAHRRIDEWLGKRV